MKIKQVETARLILRSPIKKDASAYSKIGVSYLSTGKINTVEKARDHIAKSLRSKVSFELGLFLKETGELIGIIELDHLNWFSHRAGEMSHNIKKKYQQQGYGTESAIALINYCFRRMKLHKIYADTTPENIGAQKLLDKLGFKLEGVSRDRRYRKGKWVDQLDYGLLEKEWKKVRIS